MTMYRPLGRSPVILFSSSWTVFSTLGDVLFRDGLFRPAGRPGRGLLEADVIRSPEDGQEAEVGQGRRGDEKFA